MFNELIELRHVVSGRREGIPVDLVDEVIKALPDDGSPGTSIREKLQQWRQATEKTKLSLTQLQALESELADYAHKNPSKLGMVGKVSKRSEGKIIGAGDEGAAVSAVVVLALSLRRFIVLHGIGTELSVLVQSG